MIEGDASSASRRHELSKDMVLKRMEEILNEIRQSKNLPPIALKIDTRLSEEEMGVDSLDLAGLIVELEAFTHHDPFAERFIEFQTAGELASLYAKG